MQIIDLSHTIEEGLITYKGLPAPIICDFISREKSKEFYEPGTEFQIGKIEMVANTGTYLDCPFHRYADGKDLSQVSVESLTDLEGVLIRVDHRKQKAIGISYFKDLDLINKAVLIRTNWSDFWKTDKYYEDHPFVTEEAARFLADQHVALVGIDSHNIDDTRGKNRPVHTILLKEEIPIVEHLCALDQLPEKGFLFTALPPKIKGMGTFPVRAIAKIV